MALVDLCEHCHGPGLGGQVLEDNLMFGRLVATNLTSGVGGVGADYTDADWVRAVRHGIGTDGKSLVAMPSDVFYNFSDDDLGLIIAYLKSLPPVDNKLPETRLGPLGRVYLLQDPIILPAGVIDHDRPRPPEPPPGVTVERGEYMAFICRACHGDDLSGGTSRAPAGLNLTPAGDLAGWTEADFMRALRTGVSPEGDKFDPAEMPWQEIGQLTDDELKALWLYLKSLPPVETQVGQVGSK